MADLRPGYISLRLFWGPDDSRMILCLVTPAGRGQGAEATASSHTYLLDLRKRRARHLLDGTPAQGTPLTKDGRALLAVPEGQRNSVVQVRLDDPTEEPLFSCPGDGTIASLVASSEERLMITVTRRGVHTLVLLEPETGTRREPALPVGELVLGGAWSSDSRAYFLTTLSRREADGGAYQGRLVTFGDGAAEVAAVCGPRGHYQVVGWMPGSRHVLTMTFLPDGEHPPFRLLDTATGEFVPSGTITTPDGVMLLGCALSPDGRQVAFAGLAREEKEARVYVADTAGGPCRALSGPCGYYPALAWSPDGRSIAVASEELVEVLHLPAGAETNGPPADPGARIGE